MTRKNTGGALGRGLDALIRKEDKNNEVKNKKPEQPENSKKSARKITKKRNTTIDEVLLEVHKNPRISLWSARSAAVLRYLKKTKPEFSISKEASALIEEAVQQKYPEIWELFQEKKI